MACPDCGSSFGEWRIASTVETHGLDCGPYERFDQEYIVCRACGGRAELRAKALFRSCGSSFGEWRIASTVETHGLDCGPYERFDQEYIVCRECGGRSDLRDWDRKSTRLNSSHLGI